MTGFNIQAAAPHTHDVAIEVASRLLGGLKNRDVLDLPCGAGLMCRRLTEFGARVTGIDIEANPNFLADPACRVVHDLNKGIPLEDASFDLVMSIEGVEHLENPSYFMREMARVLRRDGVAILSTPNVDSFRSRLSRLMRGHYKFFRPLDEGERVSGHLHPIDMVLVHGAAAKAGLRIVEIAVNEITDHRMFLKELLRPHLTRHLPKSMRGRVPFYGDVIIYALVHAGGSRDPEARQAATRAGER